MDYQIIAELIDAIETSKNPYNHHGLNVSKLMSKTAIMLNRFANVELEMIVWGGLLHDVGKIFLPDVVLNYPRRLTSAEFEQVKGHVLLGFRLAMRLGFDPIICMIIHEHHENLNGTGYPNGLKNNEISIYGRIARVADTYEAMTHPRAYRKSAETHDAAMMLLKAEAGIIFDIEVVEALEKVLKEENNNSVS